VTALWFWAHPLPVQVLLPPAPVVDDEQVFLPEQVVANSPAPAPLPRTLVIHAAFVEEDTEYEFSERRRAYGRKAGAKKRHDDAKLPDKVVAATADYWRRKPNARASEIADWLRKDSEKGPLVAHVKHDTLRKKIGKLQK
jgi:hypothetical protein